MRLETFTRANGLGSDLVGAMVRDSRGDLWVATFAGLSRLRGVTITNYTTANGLTSDVITALLPRNDGALLIGTQDHGWNLWDGQRFIAEKQNGLNQAGLDNTTIHAILDDGIGHLWFATGKGIARCDCGGMSVGMQGSECSHWIEFGAADGLRSRETTTNSHPSAWRSRDGHLWFATPKGLVEVDPAHFPVNTVPPPVALERFTVDDVAQPLHGAVSAVEISAGHFHFQFDYAGRASSGRLSTRGARRVNILGSAAISGPKIWCSLLRRAWRAAAAAASPSATATTAPARRRRLRLRAAAAVRAGARRALRRRGAARPAGFGSRFGVGAWPLRRGVRRPRSRASAAPARGGASIGGDLGNAAADAGGLGRDRLGGVASGAHGGGGAAPAGLGQLVERVARGCLLGGLLGRSAPDPADAVAEQHLGGVLALVAGAARGDDPVVRACRRSGPATPAGAGP